MASATVTKSGSVQSKGLLEALGYAPGVKGCLSMTVSRAALLAIFIIGCVGAAGAFPGAIGWTAVGVGGTTLIAALIGRNFKNNKADYVITMLALATIITVGALGGAGLLANKAVGFGIIGTSLGLEFIPAIAKSRCFQPANKSSAADADGLPGEA